jgi:glycosyltransferase involved in cell wall biosynthesis
VPHPAISVVVIFLNAERFLREAIDSVLAQTWTDFELVLVDDGSTDSSGAIAELPPIRASPSSGTPMARTVA